MSMVGIRGNRRTVALLDVGSFDDWWADRSTANASSVSEVPLGELAGWDRDPVSDNLFHRSGRFFSIEGLGVSQGSEQIWTQPVVNQPEIGILGIAVRLVDGQAQFLLQAKMEPGNLLGVELSPTVQATRSNYTRVHGGSPTEHLDYFLDAARSQVLVDVLQSEQGAWFWHKRNRNMVVLVDEDPELSENFAWISAECLRALMHRDHLVNMDTRTVLSCLPAELFATGEFLSASSCTTDVRPALGSGVAPVPAEHRRHTTGEVLRWFTRSKVACDWASRLIPLRDVQGWELGVDQIVDSERSRFRIVGVDVSTLHREVGRWRQPLLNPLGQGDAVLVTQLHEGILHLLLRARSEYGLLDMVEMAPTVYSRRGESPAATDEAVEAMLRDTAATVRYDQVLSEEGGRFYRALTRYRIIELPPHGGLELTDDHLWVAADQVHELLRHGHYLNVEARTLLACLMSVG